jgi:hypothetical protein
MFVWTIVANLFLEITPDGLLHFSIGFAKRLMEVYLPFFNCSMSSVFNSFDFLIVISGIERSNFWPSHFNQTASNSAIFFSLEI